MALLETENLSKSFGRMPAVDQVSLALEPHELAALIGPNGAGKTTLFNVLTGRLRPSSGRVLFEDDDITGFAPEAVVARGIARSFQVTNLFPELTLADNLRVAALNAARWTPRAVRLRAAAEVERLLGELRLEPLADKPCAELSHADQRMVEIGLALAARPKLLLLDEPTAGMGPGETEEMTRFIGVLARREGLTLLLIEHDMSVVFQLAERLVVMHRGRIIADGPPAQVREDPAVRRAYLG